MLLLSSKVMVRLELEFWFGFPLYLTNSSSPLSKFFLLRILKSLFEMETFFIFFDELS